MKNLLIITVLLLITSCGAKKGEETLRSVRTVHPVPTSNETTKRLSGVVKEAREISLGFKTAGAIEQIYVKEGDYVSKGDTIARLEQDDYRLGMDAARIQYEQMKSEFARISKLYHAGSISANEYEKASAGLQQLEIQYNVNKNKYNYTILTSPINGYIQAVNYEKSEMLQAGSPVVTILDMTGIKIETDIPASIYMRRGDFTAYTCSSPLEPAKTYPLKLVSINRKASSTQLYKVLLAPAENSFGILTAGMNVSVEIKMKNDENGGQTEYLLPVNAVVDSAGTTCVWVVSADTTVQRRPVTVKGIDSEGNLVISSGLTGEEQVVRAGANTLTPNEKVNILPEADKTNVGGIF